MDINMSKSVVDLNIQDSCSVMNIVSSIRYGLHDVIGSPEGTLHLTKIPTGVSAKTFNKVYRHGEEPAGGEMLPKKLDGWQSAHR
jgi:hypothetical protein